MTNEELSNWALRLREVAAPVGPLHSYWDIIFDIEAILRGESGLQPRHKIEEELSRLTRPPTP